MFSVYCASGRHSTILTDSESTRQTEWLREFERDEPDVVVGGGRASGVHCLWAELYSILGSKLVALVEGR